MERKRSALVIGGSLGGLTTALYLKKIGYSVSVYERVAEPLSGRGAGIVSHPELEAILDELGITNTDDFSIRTYDRKFLTRDADGRLEFSREQRHFSWTKLYNALRAALGTENYYAGFALESVAQSEGSATATFVNGESREADIIIGADGIGSRLRSQLAPRIGTEYVGYIGWRGMVAAADLSEEANDELSQSFAMAAPAHSQFVCYPVIAEQDGVAQKCYNFVWYRPAPAETVLRDLLTDETGREHPLGIPPPLIRRDHIAAMKAAADETLPSALAEVVRKTPAPFLQPIYDLISDQLAFGRCATIGDAAFIARPHVGAGVTKAAQDAQCLAMMLAKHEDPERALLAYEKIRLRAGQAIIARARYLGQSLTTHARITPKEMLEKTAWMNGLELPEEGSQHG